MISHLNHDDFVNVSPLLEKYIKAQPDDRRPDDLLERIRTSFSEGKIEIFVSRNKMDEIEGFSVLGLVSNSISLLYDNKENPVVKKALLNHSIERLKKNEKEIMIGGSWVDETLWKELERLDFYKFDRKFMQIDRDALLAISESECPDSVSYEDYTREMKDEVVNLIFKANKDNIDVKVFPGYFGTLEAVTKLLEDTADNRFGEWREGTSKVLRKNREIIGVCILSVRGTTGYIPDIAIAQSERRKGLGRYLLIKSLQDLLKSDDGMSAVALDVTLENPARYLYESVGFKDVRHYSMYSWFPDSH